MYIKLPFIKKPEKPAKPKDPSKVDLNKLSKDEEKYKYWHVPGCSG